MRRIISTVPAALAIACSGASDVEYVEGIEIGTAHQAIFMPLKYGIEGGTDGVKEPDDGMECTNDDGWEDSRCVVPDSKTIRFKFYASTCSNTSASPWQAAVVEAYLDWEWELENQGWNVVEGDDYQLRCSGSSG